MNKEEIQEYLKRVDKLELKLNNEDKDTLQWLIFGYNQCAKLLYEKEQELDRLNNIINELEKYIKSLYIPGHTIQNASLDSIIYKLKKLKEKE